MEGKDVVRSGETRNRKLEAVVFLMSLEELFGGFLRNLVKSSFFWIWNAESFWVDLIILIASFSQKGTLCEDAAFFFDRMIASCCRLRKGAPQPMICSFVEGL